ncbi:FAD-dependent oxidoreductase [Desulfitobacterium hafniense]|uniref:FAD-dependent oxidoreductase n=1 Tax=Desulfitobacterium hafniense TaxID=49338 RepID=UPI00039F9A7F|nr:FAD-dependent oxidoreductase [Desulfitobacterium hafniense]
MSNEISRRGFLKGAAGAVGAIAVTGLAGCAPQTPAAATPETEQPSAGVATADDWLGPEPATGSIAETQTFDVVIVGAGLAGICAARAAAEEGARVAIIEKSESFNCRSGEYALLNGTLNKRWGRENIVPTDVVVDRLMKECTYRNKRTILKKWAEHAHEVMDWFIEAYPDLTICATTRQAVTQEQFDKGILVPLSWPLPAGYNYAEEDFPTFLPVIHGIPLQPQGSAGICGGSQS